jgi:FecR protein
MIQRKNCIATEAFALALLLSASAAFGASPAAGVVTQASGLVFAQTADGRTKVLAIHSEVVSGDTLVTGESTYAQVTFSDRGTLTLEPATQVAIEAYSFDEAKPAGDRAEFALSRGGVRVASGAIGKRSGARQKLKSEFGTIEGAGATYVVESPGASAVKAAFYAPEPIRLAALSTELAYGTMSDAPFVISQNVPAPGAGGLNPGLYVQVLDGMIHVSNGGGSQNFTAGQFGFTPGFQQPPIILPNNPGLQFTPPPSFSSTTGGTQNGNAGGKPGDVDCIVR